MLSGLLLFAVRSRTIASENIECERNVLMMFKSGIKNQQQAHRDTVKTLSLSEVKTPAVANYLLINIGVQKYPQQRHPVYT